MVTARNTPVLKRLQVLFSAMLIIAVYVALTASPSAAAPAGTVTPNSGIDSGDVVRVQGSGFAGLTTLTAAMCTHNATSSAECEGQSADASISTNAAGAYDNTNYTVFEWHTGGNLAPNPFLSSSIECDFANACDIYLGENLNDFTAPKVLIPITFAAPTVTVSPPSGLGGTSVTFGGLHWAPSETVTIAFDSPAGTLATPTTDVNGDIPAATSGTIPAAAAVGAHTITATQAATASHGARTATTTFTVPAPTLTVNPTGGPGGTSVTFGGVNWTPSTAVTISFDSPAGTLASPTADASGNIPAATTGTIPAAAAAGVHTITATQGAKTATATFTVGVPTLTVNPTSGLAGTGVTFGGANWTPSAAVTIAFDSPATTLATPTADGTGAIPAATAGTIPATAAAGAHTITATQGSNTATATFTVGAPPAPTLTVNPTNGLAGSGVTFGGANWTPSAAVTIAFDSPATTLATPTADGTGAIPAATAGTIPATAAAGTHTITATQGSNTATATFTVGTAPTTAPPTTAPPTTAPPTTTTTTTAPTGTSADLASDITPSGSLVAGQTGTLNANVVNNGPSPTSQGTIIVTVTLPSGVTFVSGGGSGFVCGGSGSSVQCTRTAPLAPGTAASFPIVVQIAATAQQGVFTISAFDPNVPDPNTANNGFSATAVFVNGSQQGFFAPCCTPGTGFFANPGFTGTPFFQSFPYLPAISGALGLPSGVLGTGVAPAAAAPQQQSQQQQQSIVAGSSGAPAAAAPAAQAAPATPAARTPAYTGSPTRTLALLAAGLLALGMLLTGSARAATSEAAMLRRPAWRHRRRRRW